MIRFKTDHWIWNPDLGSKGTSYLGTDFNTNRDVAWFEEHFPRVLHYLFDAVELVLLPSYTTSASAALDNKGAPLLLLNTQWLREEVTAGEIDGIEEVVVHERHHVIQLLEGRLAVNHPQGVVTWEGTEYPIDVLHTSPTNHKDLPWEQEAYWEQARYLYLKRLYDTPEAAFDMLMRQLDQAAS